MIYSFFLFSQKNETLQINNITNEIREITKDIDYCLNVPREEFLAYKEKTDRLNLSHGHIPAPSRLDALLVAEAEVKKVIAQRAQEKGLE